MSTIRTEYRTFMDILYEQHENGSFGPWLGHLLTRSVPGGAGPAPPACTRPSSPCWKVTNSISELCVINILQNIFLSRGGDFYHDQVNTYIMLGQKCEAIIVVPKIQLLSQKNWSKWSICSSAQMPKNSSKKMTDLVNSIGWLLFQR